LGYRPADFKEIRRRRIVCEARVPESNASNPVLGEVQTEQKELTAPELKAFISRKCTFKRDDDGVHFECAVRFDGDKMISTLRTRLHRGQKHPDGTFTEGELTHDSLATRGVDLKELNPARVKRNPGPDSVGWNVLFTTTNMRNTINFHSVERLAPARDDRLDLSSSWVTTTDEASADQVTKALKRLIKICGGKPEPFEEDGP
jgi:hypothetical protein